MKRKKMIGQQVPVSAPETKPAAPCIACNGSGHYDAKNSPKCAACDGTGKQVQP